MELVISYRDGAGVISRRNIKDIQLIDGDHIDAYCMSRNENRTFKISNILDAANPVTGEVIDNIRKCLGADKDAKGNEKIVSIVCGILPEIMALKYFCLQVRQHRGFSKKERKHILNYIFRNANVPPDRHGELDDWLVKLWVGDMYKNKDRIYVESLEKIPIERMNSCRETAFKIAAGSGRRPIDPVIINRIAAEFSKPRRS